LKYCKDSILGIQEVNPFLPRVIIDEENIIQVSSQGSNNHGSTICMYQVQDPLGSIVTARKGPLDIIAKSTTSANAIMLDMYLWKAYHHLPQGGKGSIM
jgi:hypothetical protein